MIDSWKFDVLPKDESNRRLLNNVHPADWKNPTPSDPYNLVAIGAGTAGLISAIGTAGLGGKVALIERHLMGGDCLNVGCVPSKALIRSACLAAEMRNAATSIVMSFNNKYEARGLFEASGKDPRIRIPIASLSRHPGRAGDRP